MTYTPQSRILTTGRASATQIQAWFEARGKQMAPQFAPDGKYKAPPADLGQIIIEEARRWPGHVVNHDLLAAQISHECAAWQSRYARERNNPSGLGAVNNNPDQAIHFPSPRDGVRATVAHLLTYCAGPGSWTEHDPRASATPAAWQGSVTVLDDLEGKWAFPGDGYAEALSKLANILVTTEGSPQVATTPTKADIGFPVEVIWAADKGPARAIGSVRWFVVHKTEGFRAGDIPTLTNPDGKVASAHCWIGKDGDLVFMVPLDVTAWTSGNELVDVKAINVELEGFVKDPTTPQQYAACGAFFRWCEKQGMKVPREFVALDERPGIIGHQHVADPDGTGWGGHSNHTDPGPKFEWDTLIAAINQTPQKPPEQPENGERAFDTGFTIRGRIRDFWERAEQANVGYQGIGLPTSAEYEAGHNGRKVVRQKFERGYLQYDASRHFPWDVEMLKLADIPNDLEDDLSDAQAKLDQIRRIVTA